MQIPPKKKKVGEMKIIRIENEMERGIEAG